MLDLRLFCDVARHRSFSQAAADHDLTQSAVSQRVSALERRLRVQLIDRSVRPLGLTSAGDLFLEGARDLIERYDRLERQVSQFRPVVSGEVRVDAIYSAGIDLLNQVKEKFERLHNQVRVVLEYKRPDEVYEAVRQQRCDLGVVSYPQAWRDVGCVALRDERMVVVCAPGHPLSSRRRVHPSDLSHHAMIAFEPELPVARSIKKYFRDHGVTPEVSVVFDNIDTIKGAVAMTGQIAVLPRRTVAREALAGTLVAVELTPELSRPVGIIFRKRSRASGPGGANSNGGGASAAVLSQAGLSMAAQSFVDFLLEHAGPKVDPSALMESQHRGMDRPADRTTERQLAGVKS
jgi:DNA-binding transcriptional LysR family regulator